MSNLNGSFDPLHGPHSHQGNKSKLLIKDTFGTKKGEVKPEPSQFMKKGKLAR